MNPGKERCLLRKPLIPFLAILGAMLGLYAVYWSQKPVPTPPILFPPPLSPYPHAIAASGVIEASSENIAIGSPFNEVIVAIEVVEGDRVETGDILFRLDTRLFAAQREAAEASVQVARLREENADRQYAFYEQLEDKRAVSAQAYQQAYSSFLEARANRQLAEASLKQAEVNLERSIIRAPRRGTILQVNAHIGEIAPITPFTNAQAEWKTIARGSLILLGHLTPLRVRIDIDEDEVWRYQAGRPATAFVRGNSHLRFPLTYVRTEPYMIPKGALTGGSSERVDTRVLQVIYQFDEEPFPLYVGQVVDIFVEADPLDPAAFR